jgi:hypothetical protein
MVSHEPSQVAPGLMGITRSIGEATMFKDLIKFTAKVAIFAAVVKFVILPNFNMPNLADYLPKLPSWQTAVKFVLDPADLTGKADHLAQWVESKIPDAKIGGYTIPKPQIYTPTNPPKNVADVLDPADVFHH